MPKVTCVLLQHVQLLLFLDLQLRSRGNCDTVAADEWAWDTDTRAWDADTRARGTDARARDTDARAWDADARAQDADARARDTDTQARLASYLVPKVGAATRQ
jgi:hypothetical protein